MARDQDTPGADGEPGRERDPVFADAADKTRAKGASDDELEDLEAFLDAFEKNPEAASASAGKEEATPVVDFAAPEHVEALVHGLLKDDDFNLDVADGRKAEPRPSTPTPATGAGYTASPRASAKKENNRMTTTQRSAPAAVAALAMSTVALLISIGAGWAAFGPRDDAATTDPALSSVMTEIAGLKRRMTELSALARQPAPDMGALDQRMEELQQTVNALEAKLSATPEAAAAGGVSGPVAPAEPAAPVKPVAAVKPAAANSETAASPMAPADGKAPAGEVARKAPTQTWLVNLVSFSVRKGAEAAQKRAKAQGIDTRIVVAQHGGRTWYRLAVGGFGSADAARAYVAGEARKAGYPKAWIAGPQDL